MKCILLCAGYHGDTSYALKDINGKPSICYTIEKLDKIDELDENIVVNRDYYNKNILRQN